MNESQARWQQACRQQKDGGRACLLLPAWAVRSVPSALPWPLQQAPHVALQAQAPVDHGRQPARTCWPLHAGQQDVVQPWWSTAQGSAAWVAQAAAPHALPCSRRQPRRPVGQLNPKRLKPMHLRTAGQCRGALRLALAAVR